MNWRYLNKFRTLKVKSFRHGDMLMNFCRKLMAYFFGRYKFESTAEVEIIFSFWFELRWVLCFKAFYPE